MARHFSRLVFGVTLSVAFAVEALAQSAAQPATPDGSQSAGEVKLKFPEDPAQWLNTGPISMESLRGKGVFLWFFE